MRRVLVLLMAAGALCGCSAQKSVYWPNVVNAPMLEKRGDVHASVHGSPVDWQGNIAYAVVPHLEVRGQVNAHPGVLVSGDAGVGYFGGKGPVRWEAAADLGTGSGNAFTASSAFDLGDGTSTWEKTLYDTSFDRVALQGAVGVVRERYSYAFVLRGTRVLGEIEVTAQRKETGGELEKQKRTYEIDWTTIEPAFLLRPKIGNTPVYGELQLGTSQVQGRHTEDFESEGLLWPLIVVVGFGANF